MQLTKEKSNPEIFRNVCDALGIPNGEQSKITEMTVYFQNGLITYDATMVVSVKEDE